MSTYRVKTGHSQLLANLVVLSPQPRSAGVQVTRRTYGADGTVWEEGLYVELVWDFLESAAEYQSVLTAFGLSSANTANVTVYVRDQTFAWKRYNGLAIRPQIGDGLRWREYFPRDVVILVRNLVVQP